MSLQQHSTCRGGLVNPEPLQLTKDKAISRIMYLTGCDRYMAECVLYVLRYYRHD